MVGCLLARSGPVAPIWIPGVRWQHPRSPVLPGRVGRGVTVLKDRPGPAACRRRSSAAQIRNAATLNASRSDPRREGSYRRCVTEPAMVGGTEQIIQVTAAALPTPSRQGGRGGGNLGGASGDACSLMGSAFLSAPPSATGIDSSSDSTQLATPYGNRVRSAVLPSAGGAPRPDAVARQTLEGHRGSCVPRRDAHPALSVYFGGDMCE